MDLDSRDGGSACRFVETANPFVCLCEFSVKIIPNTIIAISSCISSAMLILKSREILQISCGDTVGTLVENLFVCGVLSLSHHGTPHTIGAKLLNLGFFVLSL